MADSQDKFEQVLKHFAVEVMERAMGLGERYTMMDPFRWPHGANNAMIGSLVPKSIVQEVDSDLSVLKENSEAELTTTEEDQIDELDEKIDSGSSYDSYSFDVFLKPGSEGTPMMAVLKYWTTPTVLPSRSYALRDQDGPVTNLGPPLNWEDTKFRLPYDKRRGSNEANIGRLMEEGPFELTPGETLRLGNAVLSSRVYKREDGPFQRVTLVAAGDIPLLYPILEMEIERPEEITWTEFRRELLDERDGSKTSKKHRVWFRANRCQVIPVEQVEGTKGFPAPPQMESCSLDGIGGVVPFLFITPISVFVEKDLESVEIGTLDMGELYRDPFASLDDILKFLVGKGREDLSERLKESMDFLMEDAYAKVSLSMVNLTYYNYFRKKLKLTGSPKWRLFQWTYLIISFAELLQRRDLSERFDFIGVRTGGGKTEAYVALTLALGFHSIFSGETPEAVTMVRFPRRTLVIDQYNRVIDLLSWANLVLMNLVNERSVPERKRVSDHFTCSLLLGNTTDSSVPFSPGMVDELYPRLDRFEKRVEHIGTYGIKGPPGGDTENLRSHGTESPVEDSSNQNERWIEQNLIDAVLEFRNGKDVITPAARSSYPLKGCPVCGSDLEGSFNFTELRPAYLCPEVCHKLEVPGGDSVNIDGRLEIFMFRTDEELVRYRPTIVLGTLDKLPHLLIRRGRDLCESFKGCFGESGHWCKNHGFSKERKKDTCLWNRSRNKLFGGPRKGYNCKRITPFDGRSFALIVHDEAHMFDDIVGGLSAPFERIFLEKLGRETKVLGMSATLSNVTDVAANLCGRKRVFIYPPSFFFEPLDELRRLHIGGLISIPREKRQFKAMHLYIFQVLLTWLYSKRQMRSDLGRTSPSFFHPLVKLEPVSVTDEEAAHYTNLLLRWVGYVKKKPNGEILWRDMSRGLEFPTDNFPADSGDPGSESMYPYFGYISGDYPFEELSRELDRFRDALEEGRVPRVMITTNIFSVGVDVGKLSIIAFHGRPDRMSEYVQSSSRVGRGEKSPGLSIVSFTQSEIRSKDIFSTFSRDLHFRYELIEKSYFNPHSIGIVRETIYPVLRMIMQLRVQGISEKFKFSDGRIVGLLHQIYFSHLDRGPRHVIKYIDHVLDALEEEYNRYAPDLADRDALISPPFFRRSEDFDRRWMEISSRHPLIPIPHMLSLRSVGDQIDVIGRGLWTP